VKNKDKIFQNVLIVLILGVFFLLLFFRLAPNSKYGLYIVKSGSMTPQILAGSVVFDKKMIDYKLGDVITFERKKQLITHEIIAVVKKDESIRYRTKGFANNSFDVNLVLKETVLGKVVLAIPLIGYLLILIKSPGGILLLGLLLIGIFFNKSKKQL